jgi:hypothetical protein
MDAARRRHNTDRIHTRSSHNGATSPSALKCSNFTKKKSACHKRAARRAICGVIAQLRRIVLSHGVLAALLAGFYLNISLIRCISIAVLPTCNPGHVLRSSADGLGQPTIYNHHLLTHTQCSRAGNFIFS